MAVCAGIVLGLFVLAGYLDFNERWHAWASEHEDWELDELMTALALSTAGFAWFSFRRWRESKSELGQRMEITRELRAEIAVRRETERALRESEGRLRLASRLAKIRAWSWSAENRLTQYLSLQEDLRDSRGRPASDAPIPEEELLQAIHPDDRQGLSELWDRAYAEHIPYEIEYRLAFSNGEVRYNHEIAMPEFDECGRYLGHFGTTQDVTDRKRAEDARMESEEMFSRAFHASPALFAISRPEDGAHYDVNETWVSTLGYSHEEAMAHSALELGVWADLNQRVKFVERLKKERSVRGFEAKFRTKSGQLLDLLAAGEYIEVGGEARMLVVLQDITEIKRAETLLKRALDASSAYCALFDADDRLVVCNEKYRETNETPELPIEPGVPLERIVRTFAANVGVGKSEAETEAWIARRLNRRNAPSQAYEYQRRDGDWIEVSDAVLEDGSIFTIGLIVTERKRAEEKLREGEERFRGLIENLPISVVVKGTDGRFVLVNQTFEKRYRTTLAQVVGKTDYDIHAKETADLYARHDREVLDSGKAISREFSTAFADGSLHSVIVTKFPLRDAQAKVSSIGSISMDITDRKQVEDQLRQAQKMEALGQLTGGVAHDFNNMLAAIIGNLEILGDYLDGDAAARRSLDIALKASLSAADLTDRLLGFSRQKQVEHAAVDLRQDIHQMRALLRTTLGETIELRTRLPEATRRVWADPVQLQSMIINLAANARDAMPNGGRLTIEAVNADFDRSYAAQHPDIAPGSYVVLSVRDTGSGMPPEVKTRVFEPFFTTKEVGKGTGMGLSTVFGFMKQLGGHVTLYSEEGHGTCVKLYLPASEAPKTDSSGVSASPVPMQRGAETILVVEDDANLGETASALLENLGYRVVLAANGPSALALLEGRRDVDLIFTDTVMPGGMSGIDLAREARNRFPDIRVLRTSGYSETDDEGNGKSGEDIEWIAKPYYQRTLAEKVRQVLDGLPADRPTASRSPNTD